MEKFTCSYSQVPFGICEKICIIFANEKHIWYTSAGMNTCSISLKKIVKSKREQKLLPNENKNRKRSEEGVCEREEKEKANERTTQLATAAPFCDIKSILFVRIYFCIQFFFFFHLPACCYLVENFRGAPPPTTWIKSKCWKRYIPAKAGFLLDFSFLFIETTDNLETHIFFFIRKKKKKKKDEFLFSLLPLAFLSYQKRNKNKKRNDEKQNNENGTSHQKWAKKSKLNGDIIRIILKVIPCCESVTFFSFSHAV